jgi:hypothetical protein
LRGTEKAVGARALRHEAAEKLLRFPVVQRRQRLADPGERQCRRWRGGCGHELIGFGCRVVFSILAPAKKQKDAAKTKKRPSEEQQKKQQQNKAAALCGLVLGLREGGDVRCLFLFPSLIVSLHLRFVVCFSISIIRVQRTIRTQPSKNTKQKRIHQNQKNKTRNKNSSVFFRV